MSIVKQIDQMTKPAISLIRTSNNIVEVIVGGIPFPARYEYVERFLGEVQLGQEVPLYTCLPEEIEQRDQLIAQLEETNLQQARRIAELLDRSTAPRADQQRLVAYRIATTVLDHCYGYNAVSDDMINRVTVLVKEQLNQTNQVDEETCSGCEATPATACGRLSCPKGWEPKQYKGGA
jgi:hypothetical protein